MALTSTQTLVQVGEDLILTINFTGGSTLTVTSVVTDGVGNKTTNSSTYKGGVSSILSTPAREWTLVSKTDTQAVFSTPAVP